MPSQFEAVAGSALGYSDDDTGSVTQATNKGTGVTLNKPSGVITMNDAALGAAAEVSFTVTNSTCTASDNISSSDFVVSYFKCCFSRST